MKRAHHFYLYRALLKCYPRSYRAEFSDQMMQTFSDYYHDTKKSAGSVGIAFWLPLFADEIKNIAAQHCASAFGNRVPPKVMLARSVVAALFFVPLYIGCYAVLVTVLLALPHPHIGGIGAVLILLGLLLVPAIFSAGMSYTLARSLFRIAPKRNQRTA